MSVISPDYGVITNDVGISEVSIFKFFENNKAEFFIFNAR